MHAAGVDALQRGDFGGAAQWFQRVVAQQPAAHGAWNGLAWACLRAGDTALALEHARRAHGMSRRNVDYLNTLGVALGESGQLGEAEAAFRKALKLQPVHPDVL